MIEKLKQLTKDTVVYGVSTILGRFIGFVLVPFYTNVFMPAEFGIYGIIYAYIGFLNIVYIYGMDAAFMKFASISEGEEKRDTFSTAFFFIIFTSIILSLLFYLFKEPIRLGMKVPDNYGYLLYYVIFIIMLDTIAMVPFANLRLERKAMKFAVIKTLNIIVNVSFNLILILGYDMGIEAIFISNVIASSFSIAALLPELAKYLRLVIIKEKLMKMLKFGIPYLPASMSAMIVQVIDRPLLQHFTNESVVGIYQANYKLGIFMMLVAMMFNYAWQPFFLTNAKEKNAKEIFSRVLTLFVIAASLVWVVLTLFIDNIAGFEIYGGRTLIGQEFLSGVYIVPIVLLGYLFNGIYYNFTAGIYIEDKTKYFPFVAGAGAATNVIVNVVCIPMFGMIGAAFATLASYIVMAGGLFIVTQRFYHVKYEYAKVLNMILMMFATGGIYYYLYFNDMLFLSYKLIILAAFVGLIFGLRIVSVREIRTTLDILLRRR